VNANPVMNRLRTLVPLVALPFALGACDWFTDFKSQPRIEPWEPTSQRDDDTTHAPRGNPQNSVPVGGTVAAGYQISHLNFPATVDSFSAYPNPTPPSVASLQNGRKYYTINCAVCHGEKGTGDGPVTKYGFPMIGLSGPPATARSDGYIFGMIRNGRGLMPPYNRIEEMDRWDVVNYVRSLQGTVPNLTGGTAPYGYPGQTGAAVPGPTRTAPTVPAPMWRPTGAAAPVASDSAAGLTARPASDSANRPTETKRGTP
jgi:mono/diheme cytochrome c family protein